MASQNNWTPPGTSVEVTFERRAKASARTMTAAMAVDRIVSVLTVSPSQVACLCSPTSIADSARNVISVIAGRTSFRCFGVRPIAGAQFLPHRQCGRQHQQHLEQCQAKRHAQPGGPENIGDD